MLQTAQLHDYDLVKRTIEFISGNWQGQPSLEEIAGNVGANPDSLQRTFGRWAGLTPKAFMQAITLDRARQLLQESATVLDTTYEVGLSGPGRLHDLFVTHEGMPPGIYRARGAGLTVTWGAFHSPFGVAVLLTTEHGLAGLAFADDGEEIAAFEDMRRRWPNASFIRAGPTQALFATIWRSKALRDVFLTVVNGGRVSPCELFSLALISKSGFGKRF
jgi:AraC family transcriptional regulator of adaptative response/methylated-DNA-[protein]-cysteine methyltransferase